jgi:quercetin dioxygenase-like cupin family protein
MSSFVKQSDVRQENFDWGVIGWRLTPDKGSKHLVIMDVTLEPGEGHDFHRHPGQEEMIIIKQGEITQYIETAHLQVVIGPSLGGETGYGLEDVSGEEPWASLRS